MLLVPSLDLRKLFEDWNFQSFASFVKQVVMFVNSHDSVYDISIFHHHRDYLDVVAKLPYFAALYHSVKKFGTGFDEYAFCIIGNSKRVGYSNIISYFHCLVYHIPYSPHNSGI